MNKISLFFLAFNSTAIAISWPELIEQKRSLMNNETCAIIQAQRDIYSRNLSPKIADNCITSIAIIESNEKLVSCSRESANRISVLPDPAAPFASPNCNSGFACASYVRCSVYDRLNIMLAHLDTFAPDFGYQTGQMEIKVFEGLRDIATQRMLFENKLAEIRATDPTLSEDEAYAQTSKWVSPVRSNVPAHSTGAAVDIRIWDSINNQFLDVGNFGVIWGPNPTAPLFCQDITDLQKQNRLYVLIAAVHAGLINYAFEHWHFSYGDRYATYWLTPDGCAQFGPAEFNS